ncbi:hypothetical protein ACIP98_42530 [Streptomyces sp. NPDC088354]|uniref:hypothetical protein n=1 Tax=Streptomyces sp. NPDC088354 TaxID=3365856 RepID=UPI0037FAD984
MAIPTSGLSSRAPTTEAQPSSTIDHRPGQTYGHIFEMGIGSGDIEGTKWASSLAELFDQLAMSLETGHPFRYDWPTSRELPSGPHCLTWDIGSRTENHGIQNWPPPSRPDLPVRLSAIRPGRGPKLGRLPGELAPLADSAATSDAGVLIGCVNLTADPAC